MNARAEVLCPACGAKGGAEWRFCTVCGRELRATCTECGKDLAADWQFCIECGVPVTEGTIVVRGTAGAIGRSERWFDGWRIVTGLLSTVLVLIAVYLVAAAPAEHKDAIQCESEGGWFCWDFSEEMTIGGVYILSIAACFAAATVATGGGRRKLTWAGATLAVLPLLLGVLAAIASGA